ncbi:hypothetical protein [Desulfobacter sp.]|uniref:hypothetical protein n=1 Tax=Desulfobacter sp. TaxID=2294 RepID=UPI000E93491D|nr:hypothetical protein [Desulfobacter sp.]HBT88141.1 hypothetical protein [Desulfobacter sp.]
MDKNDSEKYRNTDPASYRQIISFEKLQGALLLIPLDGQRQIFYGLQRQLEFLFSMVSLRITVQNQKCPYQYLPNVDQKMALKKVPLPEA